MSDTLAPLSRGHAGVVGNPLLLYRGLLACCLKLLESKLAQTGEHGEARFAVHLSLLHEALLDEGRQAIQDIEILVRPDTARRAGGIFCGRGGGGIWCSNR